MVVTKEDLVFSRSPRIVKLHGSFPSQRPFVITEEDYRRYPQDSSFFVNTVQQSLIENLFCLIGFSGDDPNFLNWIGWIRDNLGKDFSPNIYLLGVFNNLQEPQRRLLECRNIIPVDLSQMVDDKYATHAEVLGTFFAHLKEKTMNETPQWGKKGTLLPDQNADYEAGLQRIVQEWKTDREKYPGWVVLPYIQRNFLWSHTEIFWRKLSDDKFEKLPEQLKFDFIYEMCWRFDKVLYPLLGQEMVDQCEKVVHSLTWQQKATFSQWFEIALMLLKEYRTDGKQDKWNDLIKIVTSHTKYLSEEELAKLYYERSLFALFSFDIPLLKKTLQEWPEMEILPFMEAKKAMLFAEVGESVLAKKILENALDIIRKQQNTSADSTNRTLLSQEGCIISMLSKVESADDYANGQWNFSISEKYEERKEYLRRFHCDPTEEILLFSASLLSPS